MISEAIMPNRVKSFFFLCALLFPSSLFCQSDIPAVLKELLKERINAISSKDTSALNRLCTKNYQAINSAGVKMTLGELKTAVMKTETPVKQSTILSYQPFIAEDESMAFATFEIEEEIVKGQAEHQQKQPDNNGDLQKGKEQMEDTVDTHVGEGVPGSEIKLTLLY
jgi:hypothetical protein